MVRTILLFLLLAPGFAGATVLAVPVPALQGTYTSIPPGSGNDGRIVVLQLPAIPSVIHSVKLHLKGTMIYANYSCDGSGGYGPPGPVPVHVGSAVYEGDPMMTNQWGELDGYPPGPGAFDVTMTYAKYPGPDDWSFLLDGKATLSLGASGVPPIMECNLVGDPDRTTFDEVTVLVDGEFPTPVSGVSWGSVKAIYR